MSKLSLSVESKRRPVIEQEPTHQAAEDVPDVQPDSERRVSLQVLPSLAECEQVIERGRQTFREVGAALAAIRDGRLYRETHQTFEAYCRERWGWTRQHANRQIAAAAIAELEPMGSKPANERQARKLRTVTEEKLPIDPVETPYWDRLIDVMDVVEALSASDASSVADSVPDRRRAATAKRLRKLGTFLGRIAWALESNGESE